MQPSDPVQTLRGLGPKKAEALTNLNITTLDDLMHHFPRTYQDRREVKPIAQMGPDETGLIVARVIRSRTNYYRGRGKQSLRLDIADESGGMQILFFQARYLLKYFQEGEEYAFFGKVTQGRYGLQMVHPEFCPAADREEGIIPIYPLTQGITQRDMLNWQKAIRSLYGQIEDHLPEDLREKNGLLGLAQALEEIHFPQGGETFVKARSRLIFDEFFLLQTGIMTIRSKTGARKGAAFERTDAAEEYISALPFALTFAQRRCADEILADLAGERVMNRLVQGDVGSGKTAVAEIAIYAAVRSGYQAVMMAPTEILARQHYDGISRAFAPFEIRVGFLSGSCGAAEKRQILEDLASGDIQVLVGTHALIQPEVQFSRLGLVITDEQHRFGVNQRIRLQQKGEDPNILVMTATPIPRTLAVILYGDLDISVIDEMPPGRKPVKTYALDVSQREKCYEFVEKELAAGHQAYVVTPLIDTSDALEIRSAQETAEELKERFSGAGPHGAYRVGLLHGSMKTSEKDQVMEAFGRGDIDLLVATVVIEVGINVPTATVMVIENSERFGLAQMHQLRGRVGRGDRQSWCFLIRDGGGEIAEERAAIMASSSDGFAIAEEDLRLRGPGDLFGTRQHGLPALHMADLVRNRDVLAMAREEAKALTEADPALSLPEHRLLKEKLENMFGEELTLAL